MKKINIALLSGGVSSEREISLKSGDQIYYALDNDKYNITRYDPKTDLYRLVADAPGIDVAFIAMHGRYGEDGTLQGLLDLLDIPYQGSGVLGSAIALDKVASKHLYERSGIPVPPYIVIRKGDKIDPDDCIQRLGLPIVTKPVTGGSSIGMSIVDSRNLISGTLDVAFRQNNSILMESYIKGIELTAGVIGNDDLTAFPLIAIIPAKKHVFFDYNAKYEEGDTKEICPAPIDDNLTLKAQTIAKMSHKALFCSGYSRTDMILKGRDIYVLETNTIPGMTRGSLLPLAAKTAGIPLNKLIDQLIELGIEKHRK